MDIKVAAKGTGDWTITIHDTTNRIIASKTITNANMASAVAFRSLLGHRCGERL
jgi:hypothetical protein